MMTTTPLLPMLMAAALLAPSCPGLKMGTGELQAAVMDRVHREFRVNFDDAGKDHNGASTSSPCNYYQKYHKKITET